MTTIRGDASTFFRAIGYARVSTEEQDVGLEAQEAGIRDWCAREGLDLVGVHRDLGISGAAEVDDRPGLVAALADLRRGDVLVVFRRDRLGRDRAVVCALERLVSRRGARIAAAAGCDNGDSPEARLLRHICDDFAEYERDLIRWRTRVALEQQRRRGLRTGGVPYGRRVAGGTARRAGGAGVALEVEPGEAAVLSRLRAWRSEGFAFREMARRLNAEGIGPRRGRTWHASSVRSVLLTADRSWSQVAGGLA